MRALLVLLVCGVAVALAYTLGWWVPLDHGLRELRFRADHRPPSGQIVFVEIDARSLEHVGVWPWPRRVHAELLTTLLDMGADTVAFDIDFSVASNEVDDAAFEQALMDAGGYATLVAFRQLPRSGEVAAETMPLSRFASHAELAAVNVAADNAGVIRSSPISLPFAGRPVPSLPVALAAGAAPVGATEFLIDYSIDPGLIPRYSVAEILDGSVGAEKIEGRQIVVAASALELRDVMMSPKHGALPGGLIQILAAESIKLDRALQPPAPGPALVLVVLVALLVAAGRRWAVTPLGLAGLGLTAILIEAGAYWLQAGPGLIIDTAPAQLSLLAGTVLSIAIEASARRRQLQVATQQRTEALERLAHIALFDELTGAATRQGFLDRVDQAMAAGAPFAIAAVGLDRFERITGSLGHGIGDLVLKEVARRIGGFDPLCMGRISGENLAVLLSGDAGTARSFERGLRDELDMPLSIGGHQLIVGCHVGYITWTAADGPIEPALLLRRAEQARSAAATVRGGAATEFDPAIEERLDTARRLELALHNALERGGIALHLQGQFDLTTGGLTGAEALSRWEHPTLGRISPAQFIPLAEDTGMAVALGEQVLRRACDAATRLPDSCRIAVNVSPVQFELDDVPALVARTLGATGLAAARLDVEITEGLLLADGKRTIATLERLRQMGVGVALDDFGTGFSSLSYLGSLPIDKLKIDQSFVRRMAEDDRVRAIVVSILDLCRTLKITSVAEGIEQPAQSEMLRAAGCDIGQGYLFHRPEAASAFIDRASRLHSVAEAPRLIA